MSVQFKNASVATLTVVGGSTHAGRDIVIVGSRGEIRGRFEDNKFGVYETIHNGKDSRTEHEIVDIGKLLVKGSGHGSGDECIMRNYVNFLNGDKSLILITALSNSINGHLCVYSPEQCRKEGIEVKNR